MALYGLMTVLMCPLTHCVAVVAFKRPQNCRRQHDLIWCDMSRLWYVLLWLTATLTLSHWQLTVSRGGVRCVRQVWCTHQSVRCVNLERWVLLAQRSVKCVHETRSRTKELIAVHRVTMRRNTQVLLSPRHTVL